MNQDSVFSKSRFEFDGSHLYFLDKIRLSQLEGNSPVLLYGSRGTGKTTLLNTLNWREQEKNQYLITALGEKKYQNNYLGVYVKLSSMNVEALSKWKEESEQIYAQIFAYYLDLIWLEQLTSALGELSFNQEIEVSAADEREVCKKIVYMFPALLVDSNNRGKTLGFSDLSYQIRYTRENIEGASLYGESAKEVHSRYNIAGQVGELGRSASRILQEPWLKRGNSGYKFKICFDECECLDDYQIKILSTIVRLSNHPAFFVYSFISLPENFYSTLVNNLFIAKADIEHIALDEMGDTEFRKFAQGVVSVRLLAENIEIENGFDNEKVFGKLSINSLIEKILKRSESKKAHDLISLTKEKSSHPFYEYYKNEGLPYYQVYLSELLDIDIEHHQSPTWSKARRVQESKEIRKKMVAAYLSICNELKIDPIYASSEMVFQICDRSIRDYLWLLHEMFIECGKPLEEFVSSLVPVDAQDKAIKRASLNKIKSLPSSPLTDPGKIYRVVFGLGHLTSLIQRTSADKSHLKSSERGLFILTKGITDYESSLLGLVVEAAEAGFLKILSSDQNKIVFRVHTSLSPYFGFSYRGAYYETRISYRNIHELKDSAGESDLMDKVKSVAGSLYNMENSQIRMDGF